MKEKNNYIFLFAIIVVIAVIFSGCTGSSVSFDKHGQEKSISIDQSISKEELDRLRKCSNIVKYEYRPKPGGGLQEQYRTKYLSVCLRKPNELPFLTQKILKSVVANLTNTKSSGCTATLISSKLALTARHCFIDNPDIASPIGSESLNLVELSGIDWKVTGVKVVLDPFDTTNALFAKAKTRGVTSKQALDFVAISPKDSNVRFGFGAVEPIQLASQAALKIRDRLIMSSFFPYTLEFVTDNFPSCLVTRIYDYYFQHHCQSIGTSSGAPVFSYSGAEPKLLLVGIHVGREGYLGPVNHETENEALLLPDFLVNALNDLARVSQTDR
jgi:V8-like Glu-specific endopeptidase